MKKHMRLLAMLMALVMIVSMFAACGGSEDPAETSGTTPSTSASDTTPSGSDDTTPATSPDDTTPAETTTEEPGVDLNGFTLTFSTDWKLLPSKNEDGSYTSAVQEEYADRLIALEDEFGFTIEPSYLPGGDIIEVLTAASMSQDHYADLIMMASYDMWPLAKNNVLLPLDGDRAIASGLDVTSEDHWYQPITVWSEMFDHIWGLSVGGKYISPDCGYFVQVNKELCASAGYPDIYELVRNHEWTWDVYLDIAVKVTKDNDGDGMPDIWGTAATAWGSEVVCNGVQFVGERDGKWQLTIDTPEGIRALQFLYDMNLGTQTCNLLVSNNDKRQLFADGYAAFNWSDMSRIMPGNIGYNANHDYAVVPMPMGPDADRYYCAVSSVDYYCMANTNPHLDQAIAALNEWALVVNDISTFPEIADDGRFRTEEDMEMMMDYILPNFALNMGRITRDIWTVVDDNDQGGGLINDISYNNMTPQQAIETNRDIINAQLDMFFGQ